MTRCSSCGSVLDTAGKCVCAVRISKSFEHFGHNEVPIQPRLDEVTTLCDAVEFLLILVRSSLDGTVMPSGAVRTMSMYERQIKAIRTSYNPESNLERENDHGR